MSIPIVSSAPPARYPIQGREVRVPVRIADVACTSATYLVERRAAQALIAASGLEVLPITAGRALCAIASLDYRDGDWGRYREVAVCFVVRVPGAPAVRLPWLGSGLAFARGEAAVFLHHLPVTESFTCEAGKTIYGFPKWVADIHIDRRPFGATTHFSSDGRHVFTLEVDAPGERSFPEGTLVAYSYADGALRRCAFTAAGSGVGVRVSRGASLRLGDHPIAAELRSLGLPKRPLFATRVASMRAEFGPPLSA